VDDVGVVHVVHCPKEFLHDLSDVVLSVQGGIDEFFECASTAVFHD